MLNLYKVFPITLFAAQLHRFRVDNFLIFKKFDRVLLDICLI